MIPHDKYDKIQVDNIILAATMLIEQLSYVDENSKTELYEEIGIYGKNRDKIIKLINILKHQIDPK